jgi:hypothetical protein
MREEERQRALEEVRRREEAVEKERRPGFMRARVNQL